MKKIFSNSFLVVSLFLIINLFIDFLSSLFSGTNLSVLLVIRSLFILYFIFGLLLKYGSKFNYISLITIFLYACLYILFHNINLTIILNVLNYIIILITPLYIYNLYKNEDKKINRNIITITLILYLILTLIFYFYRLINNYDFYFEVSSIISVVLPFLIINLEKRINFIEIIAIILSLYTALVIGTKLPLIVFLLSLLYLLMKKFIKDAKNKRINYTNIILFIIFIIVFIYKFNQTPLYNNIIDKIHKLNINNPIDVLSDFKLFDSFVFSGRLTYLKDINTKFISSNISIKLFGLDNFKYINMDLFDIFYLYGVVGLSLFIILISIFFKKVINRKDIKFFPILIVLITSILSGRVFVSPSVSLIASIIICNTLYKRTRKKILIASNDMRVGGIEKALVNFIKNINNSDNEIVLFLEKKQGVFLKELPNNITIKQHKVFNLRFKPLQKMLNMSNKILFLLTNFKEYDFSCCYATYSLSSNFLARYASNNNSIYIHNDYTQLYKNDIKDINDFFNKRKLDKFKYIIFVSNESKDNLVSIYPRIMDKAKVINNFIDPDKIISLSKEIIKEKKPRGKKLFVYVGRVDEDQKNITRLINSFKLSYDKNKNIELWVIGDGPDLKLSKKTVNELKLDKVIKFFGSKSNPYPYIKLADYIILTSNYEGFPVIYLEAIVLGKSIVTTVNVTDEFISIPNNFGYICKKDENDISDTIVKIINSDNLKYKKIDFKEINNQKYDIIKKML